MTLESVRSSPVTVDVGWLRSDMSQSPQTAATQQSFIPRERVPRSPSPLTFGVGETLSTPMPRVFTSPNYDYSWAIAPECQVVRRIVAAIRDLESPATKAYADDMLEALRLHSEFVLEWGDLLARVFSARQRLLETLVDYQSWVRVSRAIDPHAKLISVPERFVLTITSDTPPPGIDEEVAADIEQMFEND